MNKEAYFNDIDGKKLYIDYVIFEYDYPILFVCIDKNDDLYLCHCYEIRKKQEWIISKTNKKIIIDLLTNKLTIFDSLNSPFDENYIVTWSYEDKKEKCYKVKFEDIDELNLPEKGAFYESEEHEFDEYIKILSKRENKILEIKLDSEIYIANSTCAYIMEASRLKNDNGLRKFSKLKKDILLGSSKSKNYREENELCY